MSDLALSLLPVPVYQYFVSTISHVLVTPLRVRQPRAQMSLSSLSSQITQPMVWISTNPWFVFLNLRFHVSFVKICKPFDIAEQIDGESVFGVERVVLHGRQCKSCLFCSAKLNKNISREWEDKYIRANSAEIRTHPLLLPVVSSHGTKISSGLTRAPFRVKTFATLATSASCLDLSIMGTRSTTIMFSSPSCSSTWYLEQCQ